jgi:predicted ester cyclase
LEWFGGGTWQGKFAEMAPNGRSFTLRGCGFFHLTEGKIRFQRGYFDKATCFGQLLGIPLA